MAAKRSAAESTQLSRELIVDVALELAGESGVENLSIRKVATRLGVSPMALYRHFGSKDELMSHALEAFIVRADVLPQDALPWEDWVVHVGRRMYYALCRDASWVPVLGSVRVGAEAGMVTDAFVTKLSSAGFTTRQAVQAYFGVIQIVFGAVCLCASLDAGSASEGELAAATRAYLEMPDRHRLRVAPELDEVTRMEQIDIGLPMIVTALRHTLRENRESRAG